MAKYTERKNLTEHGGGGQRDRFPAAEVSVAAAPSGTAAPSETDVSAAVITPKKPSADTIVKNSETARAAKNRETADKVIVPDMLTVSPTPHIHHRDTTQTIMLDVIFALLPAFIWGVYVFGFRALIVCLVTCAGCVFFEYAAQRLMKRPVTVGDYSALLTGLLLGMNLPSTAPIWLAVAGSAFAVIVVKQVFGGLGQNVFNPALAARVFLTLAWPAHMTDFTAPFDRLLFSAADAVSAATPLATLKHGGVPGVSVFDMLMGKNGGSIGEVAALFLILGGVYLLIRGVITWHIPVSFIGTVAVITYLFPNIADVSRLDFMLYHILSGGLIIGALFMATDYVTSPVTSRGRLIFGAGIGLLVVFIRYFGGYPEGVSFAILIMNSLVWYIERVTKPKVFGGRGGNAAKK